MRKIWLGFPVLLSIFLSGCNNGIKLTNCTIYGVAALCGTYRVYENRASQSGRQIDLNIVVLPATGDKVQLDPYFYFAGGPGVAATPAASVFISQLSELNKTRDIVLVDQRGIGGSNPLLCPQPDQGFSLMDGDKLTSYYQLCLEGLNADLGWYTTRAYVDDVNEVRQALGYDKINIGGESYGGTVVQVYLSQYPETVRTATVMRSSLLGYPLLEHFADGSQRALDLVFARCEKDDACHAAFPNLKAEFADILTGFGGGKPIPTSVWNASAADRIVVTPDIFDNVIHYMLMDSQTAAQIPRLVHRAATDNDWDPVAGFYINSVYPMHLIVGQQAAPIYILCAESWAVYQPDKIMENGSGSYLAETQFAQAKSFSQFCQTMPNASPAALYEPPQKTYVPVLVLNADEDPQNPPANVANTVFAGIYPNNLILFEPFRSHARTACTDKVMTSFIELGKVEDIAVSCLAEITPIPFDVSR